MTQKILELLFGSKNEKDLKELLPLLHRVNEKENWARTLKNEEFPQITETFKERYRNGENLDSLLPEAFALSREAALRVLGERLYDVQILGGIVLHQGRIVEMKTGEGKTVSSVPAAYLNSLTGKGVHIVTVNDYLAERDANWMGGVYSLLGVSVGSILSQMGQRGKANFLRKRHNLRHQQRTRLRLSPGQYALRLGISRATGTSLLHHRRNRLHPY